jgi:hypothetical protein
MYSCTSTYVHVSDQHQNKYKYIRIVPGYKFYVHNSTVALSNAWIDKFVRTSFTQKIYTEKNVIGKNSRLWNIKVPKFLFCDVEIFSDYVFFLRVRFLGQTLEIRSKSEKIASAQSMMILV